MNTNNMPAASTPWNWFKSERMQPGQQSGSDLAHYAAMSPVSCFGPLSNFYRDMDQMFENAFGTFGMVPRTMRRMLTDTFHPKVNIAATDKEYIITAEAPGISEKDIRLDLMDNGTLRIRGERKQENSDKAQDMHRVESSYGFFERILSLPEDADKEDISAICENGLVTITLQRKESAKSQSRSIPINATGSGSRERYSGSSERQQESARANAGGNVPRKTAA